MLDLDFVLLPHAPLPNGFWALGPELPRRMPVMVPLAWLDPVIGSVAAGKLLAFVSLVLAFLGATKLADRVPLPFRIAAGMVYAFGPFAMPRLAVGHLFVLVAMAILPFAAPHLLRPADDLARTFRWAFALALAGVIGGVFALACVVTGSLRRGRRGWASVGVAVAAQGLWLVPGALVYLLATPSPAGADAFRPMVEGAPGVASILIGHGFWLTTYQTGWNPWVDGACGLALLALALVGGRAMGDRLPRGAPLAAVAVAVVMAGTSPLTRWLVDGLVELPGGDVLREPQRILPLFLVWAAPAAATGAHRLGERWRGSLGDVARASALIVALVAVAPGVWGAGGRLETVDLPQDWTVIRERVNSEPGTVLGLPWFLYLDLDVADGRRVNNPLPLWLGGDVLTGSDPRIPGVEARERSDPREARARTLVGRNVGGASIAGDLADLGVRWVVVLSGGGRIRGQTLGALHAEALREDPGLRIVEDGPTMSLFEVTGWRGRVVTVDEGTPLEFDPILGPFARLEPSTAAEYARPFSTGWMRGFSPASSTDHGTVLLPAGRGLVWYWPGVVTLTSSLMVVCVFFLSLGTNSRKQDQ